MEMETEIYGLQGELRIIQKKATGELKEYSDLVVGGSHGTKHIIRGNVLAREENGIWSVRVTNQTEIFHDSTDRHKSIPLPPDDYEIAPQRERGDKADRAVED